MSYRTKMLMPSAGMLLLFGYVVLALNQLSTERMKTFTGGKFEASGVAHVSGTNGVLFVDDGRPSEVFWMQVDESGNQSSAVKAVPLGASVIDLEGMTTDGAYYYVVGSQSKSNGSDREGLVRFKFDPQRHQIEAVESINGLKKFLAENVAELHGMADRSYKDGGINVEGIAWDARGNRWLLGLRSPVVDGQALIVPIRLRDPRGAFSEGNLEVQGNKAIRLQAGGAGVRSIEYDDQVRAFRLLTGASMDGENADSKLWEWNAEADQPVLREVDKFVPKLKPEGVTRARSNGRNFTFIVFDTNGYSALE